MPESVSRVQETETEVLRRRVAELEARLSSVTAERDKLRHAYEQLKEQMELLRRRIYVAKAERVDARQLELEFAEKKAALEKLAEELGIPLQPEDDDEPRERRRKPKGRRNLREIELPEERIELLDVTKEGRVERIGFDESCRLGHRRGGPVRIVVARATYKETDESTGETKIETVPVPREVVRRSLLAPSMMAHLLYSKYGLGLPFYRQEEDLRRQGIELDRGTMCRCAEDVGATLGAIVMAAAKEAKETAFCLSTDATGVLIQPAPLADGGRQPCRKGHFFVVLADRDHVFFEYKPKHTSDAVCEMFRGYSGYIQADAHAIYDALFRGKATTGPAPQEVACWSHCRRHFWEAACAKYPLGREALLRIQNLFRIDQSWTELPPRQRHVLRNEKLLPFIDEFFAWAREQHGRLKAERGLVASAFGYAIRQEQALRRFLDDGRLRMDNNASERNLRPIAVGRKAWLFCGSDDHAEAAANLFSLIASCKLHQIDPEFYLLEIIRVMPYWPRDRYLELAPKHWPATRDQLAADELAKEIGPITVPPPMAEQQTGAH